MQTDHEELSAGNAPFGEGHALNAAMCSLRRRVQFAAGKGKGCRLHADEVEALVFSMGDGEWWNGTRALKEAK